MVVAALGAGIKPEQGKQGEAKETDSGVHVIKVRPAYTKRFTAQNARDWLNRETAIETTSGRDG